MLYISLLCVIDETILVVYDLHQSASIPEGRLSFEQSRYDKTWPRYGEDNMLHCTRNPSRSRPRRRRSVPDLRSSAEPAAKPGDRHSPSPVGFRASCKSLLGMALLSWRPKRRVYLSVQARLKGRRIRLTANNPLTTKLWCFFNVCS